MPIQLLFEITKQGLDNETGTGPITAQITSTDRCRFIRLLFMGVFELGIQPRMDANARESWNVIRVHSRFFLFARRIGASGSATVLIAFSPGLFADRILVR